MTGAETIASAGFRILVAVARADGRLSDAERLALESAVGGDDPATAAFLNELLTADIDLEAELAKLITAEDRRSVYEAAFVLAYADGQASVEEIDLLERIRPNAGEATFLGQVLGETRDTLTASGVVAVADPEVRAAEVKEDTLKYALLSAVLGANPLAGASIVTDLVVVAIQTKLVRDIGLYWGHRIDPAASKSLLGSIVGSAALRVAVGQLAKLVPGWGSVYGAVSSFATTWAVGEAANTYFASGQKIDPAQLRDLFKAAKREGEGVYAANKEKVAAASAVLDGQITALNADLAAGKLTVEQHADAVAALPR